MARDIEPTDLLEIVSGDFFTDNPPSADAHMLMNVIRDWDDNHAILILKAVADAARQPSATVLVVGPVISDRASGTGPRPWTS